MTRRLPSDIRTSIVSGRKSRRVQNTAAHWFLCSHCIPSEQPDVAAVRGHTRLWDVIKGEDRIVLISQLAEDHFRKHGRPLRIVCIWPVEAPRLCCEVILTVKAVDEADWVHNNVTKEQVEHIRKTSYYLRNGDVREC